MSRDLHLTPALEIYSANITLYYITAPFLHRYSRFLRKVVDSLTHDSTVDFLNIHISMYSLGLLLIPKPSFLQPLFYIT